MPGRTVSGLAPCLIHLPEPVPVMPRIVFVKDCCFLQGLLQPEALRGTPDAICFTNAMGGHGRVVQTRDAQEQCISPRSDRLPLREPGSTRWGLRPDIAGALPQPDGTHGRAACRSSS